MLWGLSHSDRRCRKSTLTGAPAPAHICTRAGGSDDTAARPSLPTCPGGVLMHGIAKLSLAGLLVAASACYHATVDTGLTPSSTVAEKSWASGWLWGLVPPSTVETASKCRMALRRSRRSIAF